MIDAERIGSVEEHKQHVTKERCFVEAESIAGAVALRPEDYNFEIVCVQRIGNIIARERTANKALCVGLGANVCREGSREGEK